MVLAVDRRGYVLVLRLNRPEARNALDPELLAALGRELHQADRDESVRAVIITGTGDRAFCAGMDLRAFAAATDSDRSYEEEYVRFLRNGIGKPVVCAANGAAVAGGFELLLACDLVVASRTGRFGLPEVQRGLFPAGGGTHLAQRVSLAVALELALTGDLVTAERAQALGVVNRVVEPADVLDDAVALASRIAANAPLAVRVTKRLVVEAMTASRAEAWAATDEVFDTVFHSADAKEGAIAYLERREPAWLGR